MTDVARKSGISLNGSSTKSSDMKSKASSESEILNEVPIELKRLVRIVMRGFYSPEAALTMEILMHHPCIKEEDMLELLKFERRQLRSVINTLKTEKFIKSRMSVETDEEKKVTRHNFYFINYSLFVNVVKYKLDHMYRKIQSQERAATSRASYICPKCQKTFTDLEADQLVDFATGLFLCTHCHEEVEEEASSAPSVDAKNLTVTFNQQMEGIYNLLKVVEDVKLAQDVLQPKPLDLKSR